MVYFELGLCAMTTCTLTNRGHDDDLGMMTPTCTLSYREGGKADDSTKFPDPLVVLTWCIDGQHAGDHSDHHWDPMGDHNATIYVGDHYDRHCNCIG